jgi:CBS domain containing-hemolysin-like protein
MNLAIDSERAMKDRRMSKLRKSARIGAALLGLFVAPAAQASFLQGEALDTMANVIAWFVLIVMPPAFIALFWIVHVLPEKIAEKRHHPNKDGIHVLCLLSLVFGGMLWPFAWLWAYTRPVGYKLAYGTEKHEDYYVEQGELASRGELEAEHLEHLRAELEQLKQRGQLTPELKRVYASLAAGPGAPDAAPSGTGAR